MKLYPAVRRPKTERSPDRCARSYRTPGRVAFEQCHFAYRDDHYYLDKSWNGAKNATSLAILRTPLFIVTPVAE